ncbi:MAG: hypothetical protein JW810_13125 [Sedimentisphaerales bacterium]|nr:hypothetical protein [Sedimentisphaerales bacterium]
MEAIESNAEAKSALRIALLTDPGNLYSGSFLQHVAPDVLARINLDVYIIRPKREEFSLVKKCLYFVKYVGCLRLVRRLFSAAALSAETVAQVRRLAYTTVRIDELEDRLRRGRYDIGLVVSLGHILKRPILGATRLGFYNFHPGCLSDNRGPEPVFWSMYLGMPALTVVLHRMTEAIDAGDIVAERSIAMPSTSEPENIAAAGQLAAQIFNETIFQLETRKSQTAAAGTYRRRPTILQRHWLVCKTAYRRRCRQVAPDRGDGS